MPRNHLLTILLASSLLAGCAVGPNYVKPETPLPGHYIGQAAMSERVDSLGRARGASFAAYQNGVVRLIEVRQADESLLRAIDGQAQAQSEAARAAVAAFRALGGGWQPQELELASSR